MSHLKAFVLLVSTHQKPAQVLSTFISPRRDKEKWAAYVMIILNFLQPYCTLKVIIIQRLKPRKAKELSITLCLAGSLIRFDDGVSRGTFVTKQQHSTNECKCCNLS